MLCKEDSKSFFSGRTDSLQVFDGKDYKNFINHDFLPRSDEVYQLLLCEDSTGCASFLQLNRMTMHTLGFGDVAAAFEAVYTGFSMEGRQGVAQLASQNARGIGQLMH
jgi:hypothetical protein